ncbi:hypothetical protein RHMOL_Rhmol05G0268500 [Rhododendron molle]|uniref:Uncharacterized protein n=1 Tax=Rhododendron molle TaxID=49168 RepID=A0ACC0NUH2_RHOML|nr:hypothetical protein RHMOL_Rhmol05G0268500 [Rhododendron molle]
MMTSMGDVHEKLGLELQFVKVLTVMAQPSCLMTFYITFETNDLADDDKVKIYQTEVLMGPPHGCTPWSVKSLRLKPGQGSGDDEEKWFWTEQ